MNKLRRLRCEIGMKGTHKGKLGSDGGTDNTVTVVLVMMRSL